MEQGARSGAPLNTPTGQPSKVRAIPTRYKGYHFRSRLEARWAVFFDAIGLEYQYELQGFEVGFDHTSEGGPGCSRYLPDFYLPDSKVWVEIKGDRNAFDLQLMAEAVDWGVGLPGTADSGYNRTGGLLLLSDIPTVRNPWAPLLVHRKGVSVEYAQFSLKRSYKYAEPVTEVASLDRHNVRHGGYADASWGSVSPKDLLLDQVFEDTRTLIAVEAFTHPDATEWQQTYVRACPHPGIGAAFDAARSARFEHGHSGAS